MKTKDTLLTLCAMAVLAFLFAFALTGCGKENDRTVLLTGPSIQGQSGERGDDGLSGSNGVDGYSSLVDLLRSNSLDAAVCASQAGVIVSTGLDLNRDGVLQNSEVTAGSVVCDGAVGADGNNGILSIVTLCPHISRPFPEVVIQLADGRLLASFSANQAGNNTRFVILPVGTYGTTDGAACSFTVGADGSISY